jgi:GxxExxY protein
MTDLIYKSEYYEIVNAAIEVRRVLGHGFLEKVYENALAIELRERGFQVETQHPISVAYRERPVGDCYADLLVNGEIICELKCAKAITDEHIAQTLNYLKATGKRLAIILNFHRGGVEHKRLVM